MPTVQPTAWTLLQTIAPTAEPVSRDEFKAHSRIDINDEDAVIDGYLRAARTTLENQYHFQAVTATWRMRMSGAHYEQDADGIQFIQLPRGPLQEITSVTYVDSTGGTQTWSSTNYTADKDHQPGRLTLNYGAVWPSPRAQAQSFTITYRTGFATPASPDATNDTLTLSGATGTNGDIWRVSNSGGTLAGGLSLGASYYISGSSGATVRLSTASDTTSLDITSTGSGQLFLGEVPGQIRVAIAAYAAHLYENREPVTMGSVAIIPMHVDALMASAWDGRLY